MYVFLPLKSLTSPKETTTDGMLDKRYYLCFRIVYDFLLFMPIHHTPLNYLTMSKMSKSSFGCRLRIILQ